MAKHSTSSHAHRDPDTPDDAFVAGVERVLGWGRAHNRALTIIGVAAAVVLVVGFYYIVSQRRIEAQAQGEYAQVQQSLASGNTQLGIRDLQSFVNRFGSTRAGDQARLALADMLITEGRGEEAIQALGDLPDDLDTPFGIGAARLLAAAYEAVGRPDDAVATYRRIGDGARFDFQKRNAYADAARVRLQNGDPDDAANLYARVVELYDEDEPGHGYYSMWLAEARAQAREGAGTTPTTVDTATADTTAHG